MSTEPYNKDDRLIKMLAADARQAIAILYRDYHPQLLNIATGLVGSREVAKDIVQDLYFALWNQRDTLKVTKPIKAYLARAVVNRSLNFLRDNAKYEIISLAANDEFEPFKLVVSGTIIERKELKNLIAAVTRRLSPQIKATYILSRKYHMKYSEIAVYLGISKKTVEKYVSKALNSLRTSLAIYLKMCLPLIMTLMYFLKFFLI